MKHHRATLKTVRLRVLSWIEARWPSVTVRWSQTSPTCANAAHMWLEWRTAPVDGRLVRVETCFHCRHLRVVEVAARRHEGAYAKYVRRTLFYVKLTGGRS